MPGMVRSRWKASPIVDLGRLEHDAFDLVDLRVVVVDQLEVGADAELGGRIGEALGEVLGAIARIAQLLAERRMVVLAVGVDDVRDELRTLVDEEAAPPHEVARRTRLPADRRTPSETCRRAGGPAILAASMRSFFDLPPWIAFMYRAWPSVKGIASSSQRSASQYQANMHSTPTTRPARNGAIAFRKASGLAGQIAFEDGGRRDRGCG